MDMNLKTAASELARGTAILLICSVPIGAIVGVVIGVAWLVARAIINIY